MPKQKTKMSFKYILRRFILIMVLLGTVGAFGWYIGQKGLLNPPADTSSLPPEIIQPESSDTADESAPEIESEPETEPQSGPSVNDWELMLVNPSHPLPEGYTPELETITEDFRVDKRIADSVKLMFIKAKEDGIDLKICSAYRTEEYQQILFDNKRDEYLAAGQDEQQAVAAAATIIAKPGTSEHHTGLALDIVTPSYQSLDDGFAGTPAFKWLNENAHKYGFILRYPKDKQDITEIIYEPWHYRYVGENNAALMKQSGECLEEYLLSVEHRRTDTPASQSESGDSEDSAEPNQDEPQE